MEKKCWRGESQFGIFGKTFHSSRKEPALKTSFCSQGLHSQNEHLKSNRSDRFCMEDHSKGDSCLSQSEDRKGTCVCFCCRKPSPRSRKPTRVVYYEIPKPKFGGESVTVRDYKVHPLPKREIPSWHPLRSQPWKRLTIPCQTETTYKMDFQPPAHGRLLPRRAQVARE